MSSRLMRPVASDNSCPWTGVITKNKTTKMIRIDFNLMQIVVLVCLILYPVQF